MYSLAAYLLRPYVLVLLLLTLAPFRLWRRRAEQPPRLLLLAFVLVILIVISTPAFSYLAVGSLEWQYAPLEERPQDSEAIVVLGGGMAPADRGRSRAELDASSLYRCLEAARLYHQGRACPVLVSGAADPDVPVPSSAEAMAKVLIDLGVQPADVIVEGRARTTYENAVESRILLEQRQITRIVVVTEATHLHRAVLCFRKQGFEVIPSGCHPRKTEFKASWDNFLPSVGGLNDVETASHEWVGLCWYYLTGRI